VNMGGGDLLNYYIIPNGSNKKLLKEGLRTNEVKCYFTSPKTTDPLIGEDFYFTYFDDAENEIVLYLIGPSSNYELEVIFSDPNTTPDVNPLMTDNVDCSHFAIIDNRVFTITHDQGGTRFLEQNMYYELFNNGGGKQIVPTRRVLTHIKDIIDLRSTDDFLVFYGRTSRLGEKIIEIVYFDTTNNPKSINLSHELKLSNDAIIDYTTSSDSIYITTLSTAGKSTFHTFNPSLFINGNTTDASSNLSLNDIGGDLSVYSIK